LQPGIETRSFQHAPNDQPAEQHIRHEHRANPENDFEDREHGEVGVADPKDGIGQPF